MTGDDGLQRYWVIRMYGSHEFPFTQQYLDHQMHMRRVRRDIWNLLSAQECRDRFICVQAEKIKSSKKVVASPGLMREMKRQALAVDFEI